MRINRRELFQQAAALCGLALLKISPALGQRCFTPVAFDRAACLAAVKVYRLQQPANQLVAIQKAAIFAELETLYGKTHHATAGGNAVFTRDEIAMSKVDLIATKTDILRRGLAQHIEDACLRGYWEEPHYAPNPDPEIDEVVYVGVRRIPFRAIRYLTS